MADRSDAHDGHCPGCGHIFTLADLRRMAVGDGWNRWLQVYLEDGRYALVDFDHFDPKTMTEIRPDEIVREDAYDDRRAADGMSWSCRVLP